MTGGSKLHQDGGHESHNKVWLAFQAAWWLAVLGLALLGYWIVSAIAWAKRVADGH